MVKHNPGNFRWFILVMLFIATTILYLDRSAMGILAPFLQKEIGWSEIEYGYINSVFMISYAICFLLMGRLIDKIGTRKGYLLSIGIWSVAALTHVFAKSWVGFAASRFSLAIGQSGNFPAAIKAVAEWFPKKERALAVGIFNGGANLGTMLAPLIIPPLVMWYANWRIGFLWTFPISLLWIILWIKFYSKPEKNKNVSEAELEYINSDSMDESPSLKIGWSQILSNKQAWAIAFAKFMADPIWYFYIFWGAKFLNEKFGVSFKQIGLPFFIVFSASWLLGIAFGWLSSKFLKQGWSLNKGRKIALLACAIVAIPVAFVPHTNSLWLAVSLIALAAGGHCGWSANIFSLMSDIFPKSAIGSIAGFGGFMGAIGSALVAFFTGLILQNVGVSGYAVPFAIAGSGYIFALLIIHFLVPKIKTINF